MTQINVFFAFIGYNEGAKDGCEDMACASEKCARCGQLCTEKVDFLAGLPEDKQRRLTELATREKRSKGSALFRQGDPVDAIYILHSGRVKLSAYDPDGRERISGLYSGGDTLWEGVLVEDSRYPCAGICMTDVDLCRLDRRALEAQLRDPAIALRVIGFLSKRLRDAHARGNLLAITDPLARLCGFLLERSRKAASDTVTLRLEDIAASISLRPETVSRKLRELEKRGLTERVGQSGIRIIDINELRTLSENG